LLHFGEKFSEKLCQFRVWDDPASRTAKITKRSDIFCQIFRHRETAISHREEKLFAEGLVLLRSGDYVIAEFFERGPLHLVLHVKIKHLATGLFDVRFKNALKMILAEAVAFQSFVDRLGKFLGWCVRVSLVFRCPPRVCAATSEHE